MGATWDKLGADPQALLLLQTIVAREQNGQSTSKNALAKAVGTSVHDPALKNALETLLTGQLGGFPIGDDDALAGCDDDHITVGSVIKSTSRGRKVVASGFSFDGDGGDGDGGAAA